MNKNWSNTSLVAYSLIPKIGDELDKCVISRVNSSYKSRHLKIGISNEQLIGEIIELNEQKRKIANLRYIVKHTLSMLSDVDRRVLVARIINKHTFQSIAELEKISLRTVFRRLANAEENYAIALKKQGYTEEWFEKEYGNDKYIISIKQRVSDEKYFIAKNM